MLVKSDKKRHSSKPVIGWIAGKAPRWLALPAVPRPGALCEMNIHADI
jgi:hypothetical protein